MTILQKLKQKSQQALQGVGNFIDRDQDMGGVQFTNPNSFLGKGVRNLAYALPKTKLNDYNIFANAGDSFIKSGRTLGIPDPINYGVAGATEIPGALFGFGGQRDQDYLRNITKKQDNARRIGKFLYGSALTAPLGGANSIPSYLMNTARNAAVGAGMGGAFTTGGSLWNNQRLPTGDELKQGVARGAENSWLFPATSKLTDVALNAGSKTLPFLANYTDEAIGAATSNGAKLTNILGKNIVREVSETPLETAYMASEDALNPDDERSYAEIYKDRFAGDLVGNAIFGGIKTGYGGAKNFLGDAKDKISSPGFMKMGSDGKPGDVGKKAPVLDVAEEAKNTDFRKRNWFSREYDKRMNQTPERLKKIFGETFYNNHLQPIMDSANRASGEATDFVSKGLPELATKLTESDLEVGNKDLKYVWDLRKKNGYANLVKKVGETRAQQIKEVYDYLRADYDTFYKIAAPVAKSLGKNLPKLDDFLSQQGNKFKKTLDFSDSKGITSEFSSSIFKEQGKVNQADPISSYVLYKNKIANLIYMEPEAAKMGNIADDIAENKNTTQEMVSELNKVRNDMTGAGKEVSGIQQTINKVFGKAKAAAVLGKVGTLASQALGIPGASIDAGLMNTIKGNLDPKTRKLAKETSLLKSVSSGVPAKLKGNSFPQKVLQTFEAALSKANKLGYEIPIRGFIKQAEQSGIKGTAEIVKIADRNASSSLGDRRAWMTPETYNTFFGKLVAPYTQEQTAQASKFLKSVGDKKAGQVMQKLILWKLGNEIWEKTFGYSPYFDPQDMTSETIELWGGSDEKEESKLKAFMRVVEEGLTLLPPIQAGVNLGYSLAETVGWAPDSGDVFANDRTWMNTASLMNPFSNVKLDENEDGKKELYPRNITGNKTADVTLNVAAKYIPGVEQINRTTQAANSLNRGYAVSKKGNPQYEAPKTVPGKIQSLLLGQSSTKEAQEKYANDFDWGVYGKDKEIIDQIPSKEGKLEFLRSTKEKNIADKRLESVLEGSSGKTAASDISLSVFDGKSATSKSIEDRMSVYKALNTQLNNEDFPDSYKDLLIETSGASKKDVLYYNQAAKDMDVKLQEILPKLDKMDNDELFTYLMAGRKEIADKQLITSDMIVYLYDKGYIDKNQKAAIKALKYDQIKDEFYYSRDYNGGSKRLTYKQALALFKTKLPKYSELKSFKNLNTLMGSQSTSQTGHEGEKILEDILKG